MSQHGEDERSFPLMKPRDTLTPTAAILGLSVASIALIVSILPQNPSIVRNFATIMIGVVILFVATAVTTSLATFFQRQSVWRFAVGLYVIGWIYFGGVLFILFIGYATGIESFQLPQFNISFGLGIPLGVALFLSIVFGAFILYLRRLESQLIEQLKNMITKVDTEKVQEEKNRVLEIEKKDVPMSVVKTVIEIEGKLREIALASQTDPGRKPVYLLSKELVKKGIIDDRTFKAIAKVWDVRNAIVHARPFSKSEAAAALDLSMTVLVALEELHARQSARMKA